MIKLSQWYERVRQKLIVDAIKNHPKETGERGKRLGKSSDWIFRHAISGGQANFDEPIDDLSPRDRVLLYALFNQKGHVPELVHAFLKLAGDPHHWNGTTMLDIGCGPITAGLALANVAGSAVPFRYFGVDSSREMCAFARELAEAARAEGGLHAQTTVEFSDSTDHIDFGSSKMGWTVVVLSYLLASKSLDVELLVRQIAAACGRIGHGPVVILYTNSALEERRAAFPKLQGCLEEAGFKCEVVDTELLTDGEKSRDIHYALFTRAPQPIPLTAFKP